MSPWTALGFGGEDNDPQLMRVQRRMYQPVAAFLSTRGLRFFSGEKAKLTFDAFDDASQARTLDLKVAMSNAKSALAHSHFTLQPGGYKSVDLYCVMPSVSHNATVQLNCVLLADGSEVQREQHRSVYFLGYLSASRTA